jgi:uncharacterized membrane protein YfcA
MIAIDQIQFLALALVIFAAFTTQTAVGFGSTIIALIVGAHLYPVKAILPLLIVLSVVVCSYVTVRHRRQIDRSILFGRILPLMGLGLPLGLAVLYLARPAELKIVLGLVVVLLAAIELVRTLRTQPEQEPTTVRGGALILVAAGIIHGLYATGGPLAIYYAGRRIVDKGRFRSTMSAVWLVLDGVLLLVYFGQGLIDRNGLIAALCLCLPLALGIACGEWIHGRVNARAFRIGVFALLIGVGSILVLATLGD